MALLEFAQRVRTELRQALNHDPLRRELLRWVDNVTESVQALEAGGGGGGGNITEDAGASVTVAADDAYILLSGTGQAVTLPAGGDHDTGIVTVKDKAGDAGASPIVITPDGAETIDGQADLTLDSAYAAVTLVFNGTDWSIT